MKLLILASLLLISTGCASATEQIGEPAKFSHQSPPQYPSLSRRYREEGKVILRVKVLSDGKPADIQIYKSSGYQLLDAAGVESLKDSTFIPAKTNTGSFIESYMVVPITFQIFPF
jgi:periplasmic protein TonB